MRFVAVIQQAHVHALAFQAEIIQARQCVWHRMSATEVQYCCTCSTLKVRTHYTYGLCALER